jgi:colicin import membrane protein
MSEAATRTDESVFRYGWRTVTRPKPGGGTETVNVPLTREDYLHPQEGDHFMITDAHLEVLIYLRNGLRRVTRNRSDIKVLGDHRVDFQVDDIEPMGPDVILLTGDGEPWPKRVGTYPVKERGATAALVVEVTSPSTRKEDLTAKVLLYHAVGVRTYVIIDEDPNTHDWYPIGYRYTPDGYVRFAPDSHGRLSLEVARVWLAAEGDRVRLYDEAGTPVPDYDESEEIATVEKARSAHLEATMEESILARQQAEREAEQERQARQQAEREARTAAERAAETEAKLRDALAEIERLKGNP